MTFGEKLLNLRRARGWTQEELADQIGVTRQALSKWEASSALPDTKNVVALSKLFGVTTDYLLCDDEGAGLAAGAREDSAHGETRNISVVLGIILLILGFAGLLALGIAGSFFDTIYSSNGQEYRYLSAMLRTNYFLLLLFILAIVSALTGAIVLIRQIFRKKLDKFSAMQSEIRATRENEAEKQRRELYNSAKSEISSAFKNEAKKNSEEP